MHPTKAVLPAARTHRSPHCGAAGIQLRVGYAALKIRVLSVHINPLEVGGIRNDLGCRHLPRCVW